jgi:hypothetical protein
MFSSTEELRKHLIEKFMDSTPVSVTSIANNDFDETEADIIQDESESKHEVEKAIAEPSQSSIVEDLDTSFRFLEKDDLQQEFALRRDFTKEYTITFCLYKINTDLAEPFLEIYFIKTPTSSFGMPKMRLNMDHFNELLQMNAKEEEEEEEEEKEEEEEEEKEEKEEEEDDENDEPSIKIKQDEKPSIKVKDDLEQGEVEVEDPSKFRFKPKQEGGEKEDKDSDSSSSDEDSDNNSSDEDSDTASSSSDFDEIEEEFIDQCTEYFRKIINIDTIELTDYYRGFLEDPITGALFVFIDSTDITFTQETSIPSDDATPPEKIDSRWAILDEIEKTTILSSTIDTTCLQLFKDNPKLFILKQSNGNPIMSQTIIGYICAKLDATYENAYYEDKSDSMTVKSLVNPKVDHPIFHDVVMFSTKPLRTDNNDLIKRYAINVDSIVYFYNPDFPLSEYRLNEVTEDSPENLQYSQFSCYSFFEDGKEFVCLDDVNLYTEL